jgi:hypothetical protein
MDRTNHLPGISPDEQPPQNSQLEEPVGGFERADAGERERYALPTSPTGSTTNSGQPMRYQHRSP